MGKSGGGDEGLMKLDSLFGYKFMFLESVLDYGGRNVNVFSSGLQLLYLGGGCFYA